MEKRYLITGIGILLMALLAACKKDEPAVPDFNPYDTLGEPHGQAQSLYNGTFWEYDMYIAEMYGFSEKYTLGLHHYNEYGYLRGQLSIKNVTLDIGTYYLQELVLDSFSTDTTRLLCDFYTIQSDGDVIGDRYVPLNDSSMVFTIDQIDPPGQISGRFWGTLVKWVFEMEHDPASPDTLVISEGVYEVKLE
jgi:hypothetical protein